MEATIGSLPWFLFLFFLFLFLFLFLGTVPALSLSLSLLFASSSFFFFFFFFFFFLLLNAVLSVRPSVRPVDGSDRRREETRPAFLSRTDFAEESSPNIYCIVLRHIFTWFTVYGSHCGSFARPIIPRPGTRDYPKKTKSLVAHFNSFRILFLTKLNCGGI